MKKRILVLAILVIFPVAAFARQPILLKDINPSGISNPLWLTDVNGTLFFQADDGARGPELWKSDGTEEGTVLVKDINSGPPGSGPAELTNVNGILYFRAADANGAELWKSDGTEEGTVMLKNIYANANPLYEPLFSSYPMYLTDVNGTLFFIAGDVNEWDLKPRCTLWKSDGTPENTVMVKDIYYIKGDNNRYYNIENLTDVNGTLFFSAQVYLNYQALKAKTLWKSDGTEEGTVMVKEIYNSYSQGDQKYYIENLTNVNGILFFSALDANGIELWKSDGTEQGTRIVKNIYPDSRPASGNSSPMNLTDVGGTLFFIANDGANGQELWKSDGTEAGTVMVKDINSGPGSSWPWDLTNVGGTLFFRVDNGINGDELWKSDGTAEGTVLVKDINPGPAGSNISNMMNLNGILYFTAANGDKGCELWQSDGTPAGTFMVSDILPGSLSSWPASQTGVDDMLFFSTNDFELWMLIQNSNDECLDAQPVFSGLTAYGSSADASGTAVSTCAYNDTADVWYYFQPDVSGEYTINLSSAEFDTALAVFNACGGTELACNDDFETTDSRIVMNMTKGKTYYIRAAGFDGQTGNFELNVSGDFCPQSAPGDINGDCIVNMTDLALLAADWMTCNLSPSPLCR